MRLETRFVQVPNQPKYINSLNELARVFGWTVHIIQVIDRKHSFVSGSHGISTDYGVFVPNQGIFPPYAAGIKKLDNTTVVISRGIGNSAFPFRLFNRPEVVVIKFE